ncbi:MAG: hypothetical protein H7Y42_10650 [Chitinophagaceae bacterium]|nr:hypothetical protein [Chitinophagaceae bacterium]
MKTMRIVQTAIIACVAVVMVSCGSSREYQGRSYPPPRPQSNFNLVISSHPGLMISRHPSGRYYYRDTHGHIYWRGYGNRYYLDRRYMNRSYYNHQQYNDWKRYNNNNNGRSRRRY